MLHFLVRNVLAPLVRAIYRPTVTGAENVPAEGAVIIASNHRAVLDTAVIAIAAGRPVKFLGKAEYFEGKGLKGRLTAKFLDALGYIPVERGNARAGLAALGAAHRVLGGGGAFGIYPEGTRSTDGRLHRGHTGVAALALDTRAPVVPVAVTGTECLQPKGKRIPRLVRTSIRFGEPLDFSGWLDSSLMSRRSATDKIMYAILELSDQEYVDSYHRRPDEDAA